MDKKATAIEQMKIILGQVKGLIAQVAKAAAQDIAALTAADVGAAASNHTHVSAVSVTIPTTGWNSDSTVAYPKYYDIAVSSVTVKDRASVDIAPAAMGTAVACGMCPACETLEGKIRLRAVSVPAKSMTANYWIEKGA